MSNQDIRWIQRFNNFKKALSQLKRAVELSKQRGLTELEQQGIIQSFEYTHELAWKTLKDFLESRAVTDLFGSKDTTREAFKAGLIADGDSWMQMIKSRNLTSHTYDESTANEIASEIINSYFNNFLTLEDELEKRVEKENS